MALSNKGLTKLSEECGELIQIAQKKVAYFDTDEHPDGKGSLKGRLEDEIADVLAAIELVVELNDLNKEAIMNRFKYKVDIFTEWSKL